MSKRITSSGWPGTLALAACGWGCGADTGASDPQGDASGTGGVDLTSSDTFESDEGRFVYAVPKGHTENAEDAALRAQAAPVLARYAQLRAENIGDGKPGVLHLVRSWFHDGDGRCSPRHAKVLR